MSNPKWAKDEIILALDLYFKDKTVYETEIIHPEVDELSDLLKKLPLFPLEIRSEYFRSYIEIKEEIYKFYWIEENYFGEGLINGEVRSRWPNEVTDFKDVWDEFYYDRERLTATVKIIRATYDQIGLAQIVQYLLWEENDTNPEGIMVKAIHCLKERWATKSVHGFFKKSALRRLGTVACEACGFDFKKNYGNFSERFLDFHLESPASFLSENSNKINGRLMAVCFNCHKIIHDATPWLTVDQLKSFINENKNILPG